MITDDQRIDAVKGLLFELGSIGENENVERAVPEVTERLDYLAEVGVSLVAPSKGQEDFVDFFDIGVSDAAPEKRFRLYPMFSEDAEVSKTAQRCVSRVKDSAYDPSGNSMIMNMSIQETDRFRSCCLIHELGHGWFAKKEGRVFTKQVRSNDARLQEEVSLWTTDYQLMLAIGGASYQEHVEKMVLAIQWWDHGKREPPKYQGAGVALDACWGPWPWTQARDNYFFTYCMLMEADRYLDKERAQRVKEVTLSNYSNRWCAT